MSNLRYEDGILNIDSVNINSFSEETIDKLKTQLDLNSSTGPTVDVTESLSTKELNIIDDTSTLVSTYSIENLEWLQVTLDNDDKIISGIRTDGTTYISSLESPSLDKIQDDINNSYINTHTQNNTNNPIFPDIGNLEYQDIGYADYNQIILYGQSLSMGWDCPEPISITPIDGNFMVGSNPMTNHGNNHDGLLHPLVATKWTSGGEQPIVALTNAFSTLYRRFVNKNQKFIGSSAGEGGQSIEQLSKECETSHYYQNEFINLLNYTKNAVEAEDKTVECSAILYMQGEHNYVGITNAGLISGENATTDKDKYKEYLSILKNNMQNDIIEKYGQRKRPLFFIYEVCGGYVNRKDMSINMAQYEFAEENDDVFLLNPTYFTPDYGGGHLSTNGYRWYGEMMAKSLYKVFIKGENFRPIYPNNFIVNGKELIIEFVVPVLPLVFDTWTKEKISNMGFRVYLDDNENIIDNLTIVGNTVVINCSYDMTDGKVEVTYAGQGRNGSGNLRDSDSFHSLNVYYDDSEQDKKENYTPKDSNGNIIYGKYYPMYNWCSNFYKIVKMK